VRVFENRVLREISGTKSDGVTGDGDDYTMSSLMILTDHHKNFV